MEDSEEKEQEEEAEQILGMKEILKVCNQGLVVLTCPYITDKRRNLITGGTTQPR
jgi:hypothetical protein